MRLPYRLSTPLALRVWLPLVTLLVVAAVLIPRLFAAASYHAGCLDVDKESVICLASDMAKISRQGNIPFEHSQYNLNTGVVQFSAARNETIAFQVIVKNQKKTKQPISFTLSDVTALSRADEQREDDPALAPTQQWFAAHYHYIDDAGYTWGPRSRVLRWPNEYPDALIPQHHRCGAERKPLIDSIETGALQTNQAFWVDTWFPKALPAGYYRQTATVQVGKIEHKFSINYDLLPITLPDKPQLNAVGELYRTYRMEGVGEDFHNADWKRIAHCYQQLAHQHRMVFIERTPKAFDETDWSRYQDIYEPVLDGSLFTSDYSYVGPGSNTPVAIWRTPWPQEFDRRQANKFDPAYYTQLEAKARRWSALVEEAQWRDTEFFAYILDEVEGKQSADETDDERRNYLATLHEHMGQLQRAIDQGSPSVPIDLIWTSHADPGQWSGDPELDLTGKIRLWAPNASAANVDFLQHRIQQGDKAWFYHSGHPAVGVHSINATGIDMRTWGVIGARYGFNGQLMWAVNLGNDDAPYADPSYKSNDDRVGNGVMVYPGNQLAKIGYPASPGPIPSMRLKSWRRGLQDAELYFLARSIDVAAAEQAIRSIVPLALSEGKRKAAWSQDPADWIEFRLQLLKLIAGKHSTETQ